MDLTTGGRTRDRLIGPDVTRGVALIGVVIMNYHGYLNGSGAVAQPGDPWAARLFDPWTGVLSTRFAATFMVVAGVGVALMTARAREEHDIVRLGADRWRLARRGAFLYGFGFVFDWIWPGTILVYYGAAFVIAAVVVAWRDRWIVTIGAAAAVAAGGVQWWGERLTQRGDPPSWLWNPMTLESRSPRGLVFDTFVNGTHPMLPWFAFVCAGIVIGRHIDAVRLWRLSLGGAAMVAGTYLISHLATAGASGNPVRLTLFSTSPFDRGVLYTLNALGSAIAAFGLLSVLANRFTTTLPIRVLQVAGQITLTLYVLHALVFNAVVHRWHWVRPTGLDTALAFAIGYWVFALALAWWWRTRRPLGPMESLYRRFGG